jgi:hypothetical protein
LNSTEGNNENYTSTFEENPPAAEETQPITVEEIKFINGPKPLDLTPHEPYPKSYFEFSRNTPIVGPYYGEGWRMQVITLKGNTAVIDFGNTSDKPLIFSDENVYYVLFTQNPGHYHHQHWRL